LTAKKLRLTTAEVALYWVNHHSLMKKEYRDAIITSASNVGQLEENLKNLEKGPLPEELLMAIDKAWSKVQGIYSSYAY
jgi:aflatoxin B1 aldehyde reductase